MEAALAPSPVLYVTYSASALHERSGTRRKLESIAADFAASPSAYRLVLLYQRDAVREPFNCSLHAPRCRGSSRPSACTARTSRRLGGSS